MFVDLLHLARSLRRSPASAGAAIVTLSLTLGAGASIFAVIDAVVLRPPPFADPDALVTVAETAVDQPAASPSVSYATFAAWRERAGPLAALEAFDGTNLTLTEVGAAARLSATDVTPGFLTLLGVHPASGRPFRPDDAGRPVVLISDAFWRGALAADPGVLGRQLVLGGRPHAIVGVLPDTFFFALSPGDIWRPLPLPPDQAARNRYRVRVLARLAPDTPPASLAIALDDVSRSSSPPARVATTAVATAIAGGNTRTLGLLGGAAAIALLVAFSNLAGLLIVRSIDRRRELAVRSALGASRSAIVRLLLFEALAIVAAGAVAGLLVAAWLTPAVGRLALEGFGGVARSEVAVSWRVIGGMALVAFACACICGTLPALKTTRWNVVEVLRRGVTASTHDLTLRRVCVAGEVALAFVLLVSMALLGRTLLRVIGADPGFDAPGVLTLQVSLPAASYPDAERVASFYSALQDSLRQRFGARAVSIVDELPLTGDRGRSLASVRAQAAGPEAVVRTASAGYFDVMRIPVVAGRAFDRADNSAAPRRVVVSGSLAARLFGLEPPIGRHIWLAATGQMAEIVGVVGEVRHRSLDESPLPTVYLSALQAPSPSSIVVVRSTRPDADVAAAVRDEVGRLDGNLPVYNVRPMQDLLAASPGMPARRVLTAAFAGFAVLAVILSTIGLFGIAAHDVACRRAELALRMALGANPKRILSATLGQGAAIVGAGLAAGAVGSIWAVRGLGSVIYTTQQVDVVSIGVAAGVLLAAGAAAVLPAALRAARTDPLLAMRSE